MNNKNFIKLKKVYDERYFKNYRELFAFVLKSMNHKEDRFYEMCVKHKSYQHEILMPLLDKNTHRYIRIGSFICILSEGFFIRESGNFKYNILAIQKTDNLTGNDLKKIFKY